MPVKEEISNKKVPDQRDVETILRTVNLPLALWYAWTAYDRYLKKEGQTPSLIQEIATETEKPIGLLHERSFCSRVYLVIKPPTIESVDAWDIRVQAVSISLLSVNPKFAFRVISPPSTHISCYIQGAVPQENLLCYIPYINPDLRKSAIGRTIAISVLYPPDSARLNNVAMNIPEAPFFEEQEQHT